MIDTLRVQLAHIQDVVAGKPAVPRSPRWPALAKEWLKDHSTCAACGTNKRLEVHHLKPVHLFPAIELSEKNLITLCRAHHLLVGHLGEWASWNAFCVSDAAWWLNKVRSRPGPPTWLV